MWIGNPTLKSGANGKLAESGVAHLKDAKAWVIADMKPKADGAAVNPNSQQTRKRSRQRNGEWQP